MNPVDIYRQLWSRIGGRPWTYILRDVWHRTEGLCILALVAGGAVLGHFLWHEVLWYLLVFSLGVRRRAPVLGQGIRSRPEGRPG